MNAPLLASLKYTYPLVSIRFDYFKGLHALAMR